MTDLVKVGRFNSPVTPRGAELFEALQPLIDPPHPSFDLSLWILVTSLCQLEERLREVERLRELDRDSAVVEKMATSWVNSSCSALYQMGFTKRSKDHIAATLRENELRDDAATELIEYVMQHFRLPHTIRQDEKGMVTHANGSSS